MTYRNPCRCEEPVENGDFCRRCGGWIDDLTTSEDFFAIGAVALILLGIILYILLGSYL